MYVFYVRHYGIAFHLTWQIDGMGLRPCLSDPENLFGVSELGLLGSQLRTCRVPSTPKVRILHLGFCSHLKVLSMHKKHFRSLK